MVCYFYDKTQTLNAEMKVKKYFRMAKLIAQQGDSKDARRRQRLGAVGIRNDGVVVGASNLCNRTQCPEAHAEYRTCKMLTPKSIVFVVRVNRKGKLAMAKPCQNCQTIMKAKGVIKCYYSTEDGYAVMNLT